MLDFNKLKYRINFHDKIETDDFMPSTETKKVPIFSCYAKVDNVYLKDIEVAKSNDTLNDITVIIRDTQGEFIPTDEMVFTIDGTRHVGREYEVKSVQPFYMDGNYIAVIGSDIT